MTGWTSAEMMVVAASRRLRDNTSCFVGIGLPSTAANLAKRLHAPGISLVYESGVIGAKPHALPLSIGDGVLAATADLVVSVPEIFNYWLQPGRVDVGFLGAAQIDRHANINSTVIGDSYRDPAVRLPGAGGAPEIASSSREVMIIATHAPRIMVEKLDFVTSVGRRGVAGGPTVITDLGVMELNAERNELELTLLHPGVEIDEVLARTGWPLRVSPALRLGAEPSERELQVLRELEATRP